MLGIYIFYYTINYMQGMEQGTHFVYWRFLDASMCTPFDSIWVLLSLPWQILQLSNQMIPTTKSARIITSTLHQNYPGYQVVFSVFVYFKW